MSNMKGENYPDDEIVEFEKAGKKSIAVQLMLPEKMDYNNLHLGRKNGDRASIVFLAWKRGNLEKLDQLFKDWKIEEKGTSEFKKGLKENWLTNSNSREARNNPLALLSELVVASYLKKQNYIIENLNAWDKQSRGDVECSNSIFEVKYFPDSREFEELRINAVKNGYSSASSVPGPNETLNYYFYRLSEACMQISRYGTTKNKNVFLVFDETAEFVGRPLFKKALGTENLEWQKSSHGEYCGINDFRGQRNWETIIKNPPAYWLSKINFLFLATMKNLILDDIDKITRDRHPLCKGGRGDL